MGHTFNFKMPPKKLVVLFLLLIGAGVIVYSLIVTFRSGATKSGVITCLDSGECFWTAHIHAYIPVTICGQEYRLPIEKGDLSGPHTHEEKNLAHWHDRLAYDPQARQIIDTRPLLLKSFFEAIAMPFSNTGIAGKNNGDICPGGGKGSLQMFVGGKYMENPESYIMRDLDVVQIFFDERDIKTIEEDIKNNPVPFPALGRG
ncbi:MAG: hypothetical protein A3G07_02755 [Candidatus Doudnabacteria bacterium RIFCSPLOWO2_12_FULL_47_12]|nr:MAG: hypothetical protein A3G07_02755 [Candidatus Doudnabacteria bacterium RIFCSPLOWO2_12_FULL_47_12]